MRIEKQALTIPLLISSILLISGCSTGFSHRSVLPQQGLSMSDIYGQQYGSNGNKNNFDEVRTELQRIDSREYSIRKRRTVRQATNSSEPHMLNNPMVSMYVFPHFDGNNQDYVPGHKAYTKLYRKTHFALPGEPTAEG